ncbi:Sec-independent protein translocase TatB [Georgenia wutianyii]|uniref:Sec-independent protein translocase TatB n=1 Tax=Georgenia wutianyii TaxID=2585135 RepID=A0ABX5VMH8_9MICO|nr:Sec-independent protein translocase TatB [Georgenia wutianyii]QDB79699.1 Sec-independent protein translocase TatB [Georgenia wutianyii]
MPVNGAELLVLVVLAVVLVGPERLPEYARKLAGLVVALKRLAAEGSERVRAELGDEIADLQALDPRQYDPRRIVREALADPPTPSPRAAARPTQGAVVFDTEAT